MRTRARYGDILPPAFPNQPPAYRSLPDTASADTEPPPFIPEPSGLQLLPFHFAIWLADTAPAVVKWPPAYRSPSDTASANTAPFIPAPSGLQLLPFHFAM